VVRGSGPAVFSEMDGAVTGVGAGMPETLTRVLRRNWIFGEVPTPIRHVSWTCPAGRHPPYKWELDHAVRS